MKLKILSRFWAYLPLCLPLFLHAQLSTPTLLSPANAATGQPTTVTISWQVVAGADQYKVSVGTSSMGGGNVVWDTSFVGASYTVSGLSNGTTYYWRIKAKKLSPYQSSAWSVLRSFTVGSTPPPPPPPPPPSGLTTPNLLSPANAATGQPTTVTISWQAVAGADQYKVSVGTSSAGGGNVVWDTSFVGTSYTVSNLTSGTTYYWRIKAKKLSPYQSSVWSVLRSFIVGNAPPPPPPPPPSGLTAPVLQSPSNNAILQVPGTNLVWQPVSGATFYKVKVASDAAMTNLVFQNLNVAATNLVAQNLNFNTQYWWTVQAANATSTGTVSATRKFTTMPDNPNAVTSHPRLFFTQADLPRLRSWATNSNPVYIPFKNALTTAINNYNALFFPGGIPNPNWPDNGGTTWSAHVTESYAEFFAFWSLIDPNVAQRPVHAQRARNLLMYVMDRAILGPAAGVPFRDPQYATYDRSRVYGEAAPLAVDMIYDAVDANGNPILTAADKAKIRTVFMRWCSEQLTAYNHPTPIGLMNDKQITLTNRWIMNNYYSGHARNLTFWSLAMDAADDAPTDPSLHYSALGNSLRSYLFNVTGAWLYQQYAQYEKAAIVAADYGVPTTGLGMGSDGLSIEGSLYGESIGWVSQECLALKNAGWMDENIIGKQAKLLSSDYWTRFVDGLLYSLTPGPKTWQGYGYMGPVYQVANYGDVLRTWVMPHFIDAVAPVGVCDMVLNNNQSRLDKVRWYARNALQGGSGLMAQRISNVWSESLATYSIYYYLLLDPAGSNPPDPRPSMPTEWYDNTFGKLFSRSDLTTNTSWFNWQCHWTSINHQSGDGNQFEFFRKGEWLTKERTGYTNDGVGTTSEFHNTLALQNNVPANSQWYEAPIIQRGAQWKEGLNAGDPTRTVSIGNNFVYATGDATNLYNRYAGGANDIAHASRSIVYLKPDHIVVYDRAKSNTANRFKRFFLQFTAMPSVNGKNATVTTPGGQKVYLSNLLPAASVLTAFPTEITNATAELEPTNSELKIEDPANPADIRFLNVIQGADGNAAKDAATLIQSTAGTAFEGAVVKNTVVMFPSLWNGGFVSTTYSVPAMVTAQIVTGLTPNAGYDVTQTPNGSNVTMTIVPGNQLTADAGGVLVIGSLNFAAADDRDEHFSTEKIELTAAPNPFSDATTLSYDLPENAPVTIRVFDFLGKTVAVLAENELQAAGRHEFVFSKNGLAGGVYGCEILAGDARATVRLVLK